jgi:hypothetical protein
MSLLGSRYWRGKVRFVFLTGLAVAGCLVLMSTARKTYSWADQVSFFPLLLTAWIGGFYYRQHYGGRRWWWRTGIAMGIAAAMGGTLALILLTPWTSWPGFPYVSHWMLLIAGASVPWGVVVVGLTSLNRRRLTQILPHASHGPPRHDHRDAVDHRHLEH